jgi:hypothetical protein
MSSLISEFSSISSIDYDAQRVSDDFTDFEHDNGSF